MAALFVLLTSTIFSVTEGLTPAPAGVDCVWWTGRAAGNDPRMRVRAELCTDGGGFVTGTVHISSRYTGKHVRFLEGQWAGDQLSLHDVDLEHTQPKGHWKLCLVDAYRLHQDEDALSGTYRADACADAGTLTLRREK